MSLKLLKCCTNSSLVDGLHKSNVRKRKPSSLVDGLHKSNKAPGIQTEMLHQNIEQNTNPRNDIDQFKTKSLQNKNRCPP